jgi:alkyl sulfatase BDS1-like metallo-beta-lactamase superfamily hydrolase
VTAVVYSHSHGDHWGGVRGVVDEADVRAGKVQILAPRDFMEYSIAENIFAGNAMNRWLFYQYGVLLPVSPYGYVTQGLGHAISRGTSGLIAPTRVVDKDIEEIEVDGVRMIFQNTPNTEALSEMNTYIPEMKALWIAENVCATLHNIYTLRGALVRDALNWSKYINEALYRFGQEAEVMFGAHHWPRWGNDRGEYRLASEILDKLVHAEPSNRAAKDLLADVFEQIGYQQENPGLRNSFLAGAYELREGIPEGASPKSSGPDVIRAMSTDLRGRAREVDPRVIRSRRRPHNRIS